MNSPVTPDLSLDPPSYVQNVRLIAWVAEIDRKSVV